MPRTTLPSPVVALPDGEPVVLLGHHPDVGQPADRPSDNGAGQRALPVGPQVAVDPPAGEPVSPATSRPGRQRRQHRRWGMFIVHRCSSASTIRKPTGVRRPVEPHPVHTLVGIAAPLLRPAVVEAERHAAADRNPDPLGMEPPMHDGGGRPVTTRRVRAVPHNNVATRAARE